MDTLSRRRRLRERDAGSELVELAIVMPILVILLLGIVDFAFLFQRWEVVTNATREGARLASMRSVDDAAVNWSDVEVENRVKSFLSSGGLQATPDIDVAFDSTDNVNGVVLDTVTVSVTYPSSFIFLPGSINLRGYSEMRREGAE